MPVGALSQGGFELGMKLEDEPQWRIVLCVPVVVLLSFIMRHPN